LFISIRIAASVAQLLQVSSVPVGATMWRLLSRLFSVRLPHRHCEERSEEAIQKDANAALDCFAPLATTTENQASSPATILRSGPGIPIQ
jgi:hypothetical protein